MGSCLKGNDCIFSHEDEDTDTDIDFAPKDAILVERSGSSLTPMVPIIESLTLPMGPLQRYGTVKSSIARRRQNIYIFI
jgi:hypothetical protein